MTGWFTALANALAYLAKIKATTAAYDLSTRIERDIAQNEAELVRLRNVGTSDAAVAADLVRQRIIRAQGVAASIPQPAPAAHSSVAGGDRRPDQ